MTLKAVVLAAGQGARMQRAEANVQLTRAQLAAADCGLKAMMPIERPFLDYVLSGLADAGITDVCVVVGPHSEAIRTHYESIETSRVDVSFAIQTHPLGTADALVPAESFVGESDFLCLNGDTYYPREALEGLARAGGCAVVGFHREDLIERGNIPAERVRAFAVMQTDRQGRLVRIVEKPSQQELDCMKEPVLIGMNCWRLSPAIFNACRRIGRSPRGEFELPSAVTSSMKTDRVEYRVICCAAPVFDLSTRADIKSVESALCGVRVKL